MSLHEHIPMPGVFELDRRQGDGLTVILWWLENTLSTYVEVVDLKDEQHFYLETPEDATAREVFMHPFAYKAVEDRARAQNGNAESH